MARPRSSGSAPRGAFQDHIRNGDLVVFDGAVRLDGASRLYAPIEYPAVAHHEVVTAAVKAAERMGIRHHVGLTRSADTLYAGHPRPGSSYADYWQSWWAGHFEDLKRQNVLAAEMEASIIFVLARLWGLRAGGAAVVLDNVLEVSGETGEFDPDTQFEHSAETIERLALFGCELVRMLAENDQRRAG